MLRPWDLDRLTLGDLGDLIRAYHWANAPPDDTLSAENDDDLAAFNRSL